MRADESCDAADVVGDPGPADLLVQSAVRDALRELQDQGLQGSEIRERQNFDPAVKRALGGRGGEPVTGKQLTTKHFSGVGPVDIAVSEPPVLLELKWSYDEQRSKIFESLWDAIKLALLAIEHQRFGYVATGASKAAWKASECADLFEEGSIRPREMWDRPLSPPGPNNGATVGEDLIRGSPTGSRPLAAPELLSMTRLDWLDVRGGYQLRAIRIATEGPIKAW